MPRMPSGSERDKNPVGGKATMTMPEYLSHDLKELALSKQRVLCELADIGINPELIDYENETLESMEMMLGIVAEFIHKFPEAQNAALMVYNTVLAQEAGKR